MLVVASLGLTTWLSIPLYHLIKWPSSRRITFGDFGAHEGVLGVS